MIRSLARGLALVALLSGGSVACASPAAEPNASMATPPALSAPLKGGLTVEKHFDGPSGLSGWLMKDPGGTYYTFWTTPDGKLMLAGALLNEAGENLTAKFQDQYEPKPELNALWSRLPGTAPINTGPAKGAKGSLYVFVDPNCPFCHMLWLGLQPYTAAGLQVHWIIVGFLHEDSAGKAAALLTATDKVATLTSSQANFQAGGLKPLESIPEATAAQLKDNLALMHEFGFKGVPGIVYQDAKGVVHTKDGMPRLAELPGITGLPEQPETDPLLDRFK